MHGTTAVIKDLFTIVLIIGSNRFRFFLYPYPSSVMSSGGRGSAQKLPVTTVPRVPNIGKKHNFWCGWYMNVVLNVLETSDNLVGLEIELFMMYCFTKNLWSCVCSFTALQNLILHVIPVEIYFNYFKVDFLWGVWYKKAGFWANIDHDVYFLWVN